MKKYVLLLIVLLVIALLLTACSNLQEKATADPEESVASAQEEGTIITVPQEITASQQTETAEGDTFTYYVDTVYAEQISRYHMALSEQWDEGKYYEQEMSPVASYYYEGNPLDNAGFALVDLDHDGTLELVIGAIANSDLDPAIFEIWTLRDGMPTRLCQSGYRNSYYLEYAREEDNWLIANMGSNNAANSAYHYYYLENSELKVAQAIVFDATVNESAPWFMAYDNDWDTSNDTPIDEATAISITDAHRAAYTAPDYFPYSLY